MKFYYGSENKLKNIIQLPSNKKYFLASNKIIVALINGIKFHHLPLYILEINGEIYIIEYSENGFDQLNKTIYVYEFDTDKYIQNDWFYFKRYEYEIGEPSLILKTYTFDNAYNMLKSAKNVHFVNKKTLDEFIDKKIPSKKYELPKEEKKYFYHGSNVDIKDNFLKTSYDGFEKMPLVYANSIRTASLKFAIKDIYIMWGCSINNYVWFIEILPDMFKKFQTFGYMYSVEPKYFEPEYYPSYISKSNVPIVKKEFIPNIYYDIKKQDNAIMIDFKEFKKFLSNIVEPITFPESEIENIKSDIERQGYIITHRTKYEYGKYRLGKIYNHNELGDLKVISVTNMIDITYSPFLKYQDEKNISQHLKLNKKFGLEIIMLSPINNKKELIIEPKENIEETIIENRDLRNKYKLGYLVENYKLIAICDTLNVKITPYYHTGKLNKLYIDKYKNSKDKKIEFLIFVEQ